MGSRNMEGEIFDKFTKDVVLGDKVSLAIYFHQNAHFTLQMDIRGDHAFLHRTTGLFGGASNSLFPKNILSFLKIAAGLNQGFLAIHHTSVCFLAKSFDQSETYV